MSYFSIEDDMRGKVAVISGGTSGIGNACVKAFCSAGANVVTIGRNVDKGTELEKEIKELGKGDCTFKQCDVTDTARYKEIIDFAVEKYGKLDVLVNVAGMMGECFIDTITEEEFKKFLDTNLVSYFMASKFALPYLRKSKGVIVNCGSVVDVVGGAQCAAYCATKGGISALTKALAVDESQYGVRVCEVQPGHIETEIFTDMVARRDDKEEYLAYQNRVQWLGRGGQPEEVAYAILFMASGWASFITGTSLLVSGGYEIGQGDKYIF